MYVWVGEWKGLSDGRLHCREMGHSVVEPIYKCMLRIFSLYHSLSLERKFSIFHLAAICLEATVLRTGKERGIDVYCFFTFFFFFFLPFTSKNKFWFLSWGSSCLAVQHSGMLHIEAFSNPTFRTENCPHLLQHLVPLGPNLSRGCYGESAFFLPTVILNYRCITALALFAVFRNLAIICAIPSCTPSSPVCTFQCVFFKNL